MYFYQIIGRSKIGNILEKYLMKDSRFEINHSNRPDIVFLVGTKENVENFKREEYPYSRIVDISSNQRLRSSTNYVDSGNDIFYSVPQINDVDDYINYNYVANPGCSAIGSIIAINPIIDLIEKNIILDVRFSKSALTRHSSFIKEKNIMTVVHPFEHSHQKEINYFFGNRFNIKMVPSIIDVDSGISINIHLFKNNSDHSIFDIIKNMYLFKKEFLISDKKPFDINDFLNTENIGIFIKEDGINVLINVVFDNLTVGGAYTAYLNGLKLLGEDI